VTSRYLPLVRFAVWTNVYERGKRAHSACQIASPLPLRVSVCLPQIVSLSCVLCTEQLSHLHAVNCFIESLAQTPIESRPNVVKPINRQINVTSVNLRVWKDRWTHTKRAGFVGGNNNNSNNNNNNNNNNNDSVPLLTCTLNTEEALWYSFLLETE
jgi:hypothetical protein